MGRGTAQQTTHTTISDMTPEQKGVIQQLTSLGVDQASAIKAAMSLAQTAAPSMNVTPEQQALADQMYQGATADLQNQQKFMAEGLAGTRGLNPSDTPAAQAVAMQFAPQYAQLAGMKAGSLLDLGKFGATLGLQNKSLNLQGLLGGASTTPTGLGLANDTYLRQQLAQGKQFTTGSSTQPLMTTVSQGMTATGNLLEGLGNLASGGGLKKVF